MTKEQMLKSIFKCKPIEGRSSMGVSESYYNPEYLILKCFKEEELNVMTENELKLILKTAGFASEVFY